MEDRVMKMILVFCLLAAFSLLPAAADEQAAPVPVGCTDGGELKEGACTKGLPAYLPDGKAVSVPTVKKSIDPDWPEGADKAVVASVNLQVVILPDGSVTDIQPMLLRVTLPGEDERKMNLAEDELGFVKAASAAVAKWVYEPGLMDGEPVAVYGSICLNFVKDAGEE
jgi:hypothetical protein